ncbi:hypothetical protein H3005_15265 [Stenotrophomonas sp. Br8]|uniref:hypothetical protein n=1 Tax=Stenotrophomonas sp. Br8 TaxID=2759658 RepID=UPI00168BECA5|nr:hypothetical protein [Stenotrophomonas sp. Br8]MBD3683229.1 hypothetical protein [Stenotrophomonas sp. Br8]
MGRLKDNFEDVEMIGSGVMRSMHWARTTAVRRVLLVIGSSVIMVGLYVLLINHLSSYQLERSDYRAKAAGQDDDAIQYAELLDPIDECLAPRNAALVEFACRAADLKYSEVQRGSAVVHRKDVLERGDYPRMRIDVRSAQRLLDLQRIGSVPSTLREDLYEVMRSTYGKVGTILLFGVVYLTIWLAPHFLNYRESALRSRQPSPGHRLAGDATEEGIPFGDVPNLPHERIHHPDRR